MMSTVRRTLVEACSPEACSPERAAWAFCKCGDAYCCRKYPTACSAMLHSCERPSGGQHQSQKHIMMSMTCICIDAISRELKWTLHRGMSISIWDRKATFPVPKTWQPWLPEKSADPGDGSACMMHQNRAMYCAPWAQLGDLCTQT